MRVAFGLGSNLGDRLAHLQSAVELIAASSTAPPRLSPLYETDPVGGPEQDDYLNAVVIADLPDGIDLLDLARQAERARGRVRRERWGPRTLDVDVLDADGRSSADPGLTLPHPRAHLRAFVLVPWLTADPDAVLPGRGRVADLLAALPGQDRAGVRRRPDLALHAP